jgi:hypothetical protein
VDWGTGLDFLLSCSVTINVHVVPSAVEHVLQGNLNHVPSHVHSDLTQNQLPLTPCMVKVNEGAELC